MFLSHHLARTVLTCVVTSLLCLGCYQERNESIRLMNQGLQQAKNNKSANAIKFLKQSAETDPTNHRAYFYEGMIRSQKMGESEQAEPAPQSH